MLNERIRKAIMGVPGLPVMPVAKLDMIIAAIVAELEKKDENETDSERDR